MRRSKREINHEDAKDILIRGEYGVLTLVNQQSRPYAVPLNYCVKNDRIYFHCALEGLKITLMEANANVCFCVVASTEVLPDKFGTLYESVIVDGMVCEVFDGEKQDSLEELLNKYSPDFIDTGMAYIEKLSEKTRVFGIDIVRISGKARVR